MDGLVRKLTCRKEDIQKTDEEIRVTAAGSVSALPAVFQLPRQLPKPNEGVVVFGLCLA